MNPVMEAMIPRAIKTENMPKKNSKTCINDSLTLLRIVGIITNVHGPIIDKIPKINAYK